MRKSLSMITMVMGALALMASVFISTVGATPATDTAETTVSEAKKVFVCKYVGKPGVDEVLQSGNNPISVSVNAIPGYYDGLRWFADAQGRSYVIGPDTRTGGGQQGEPSVSQCPVPTTTTTEQSTTTTTAPTTTTTEQPTTTTTVQPTTTVPEVTTTVPEVTTTVPEVTTTVPVTTEPPVVTTEPPATTEPPIVTLPTVAPTTPDTMGPAAAPRAAPRPVAVADGQLARTGASDLVPILTLLGIVLLASGVILSRKASTV